ncbi:MAG: C1 family peptidase [Colwellia sp.]|nr:C1 family peptidase [Colwellia sp.]
MGLSQSATIPTPPSMEDLAIYKEKLKNASLNKPFDLRSRLGLKFGHVFDRDYKFNHNNFCMLNEREFSLRDQMPPVVDQGNLGSCTANANCNALRFCEMKEGISSPMRSRLFVYYYERLLEGTVNDDSGAEIRDGIKVLARNGTPAEALWPYNIDKFTEEPSSEAQANGLKHKAMQYEVVEQSLDALKIAIGSGFPVLFGMAVYSSMETPEVTKTGIVPYPLEKDEYLGGHALILTGWSDTKRMFEFQNSWGTEWGDSGFGFISYDYALNSDYTSDFWRITLAN